MEVHHHQEVTSSKVVKVVSKVAWESLIAEANHEGCPVVVHFTASWCVPSLAMNSYVEEMATSYQNVKFLLVDVDDVKEVASMMEVKAMPTFVLMKEGVVVDRFIGANPDEIRKRIDALLHSTIVVSE